MKFLFQFSISNFKFFIFSNDLGRKKMLYIKFEELGEI